MRPNTGLRDLVDKLLQARPAYIAALRNQKPSQSRLIKASEQSQQTRGASESPIHPTSRKRQLRSSRTDLSSAATAPAATANRIDAIVIEESPRKRQRTQANSGASQAAPAKALPADVAACPICNRTFKAGRVLEAHVNRCIDNPPAEDPPQQQQQQQQPPQHQQPQKLPKKAPKGAPQLRVPAKIAFHLFNDKKLKDKLKDVNLPVHGKRKVSFLSEMHYCIICLHLLPQP